MEWPSCVVHQFSGSSSPISLIWKSKIWLRPSFDLILSLGNTLIPSRMESKPHKLGVSRQTCRWMKTFKQPATVSQDITPPYGRSAVEAHRVTCWGLCSMLCALVTAHQTITQTQPSSTLNHWHIQIPLPAESHKHQPGLTQKPHVHPAGLWEEL